MRDIKDLVSQYGIAIVRVKPRSKTPFDSGWQNHTASQNNFAIFGLDDNIGVVLGDNSGGVVDIDLDSPYAVLAGTHLLPPTEAVFGRATKPTSHFLYRVANPGGTVRLQVRGTTSVEYRANGAMTVIPPSVHKETGETIVWEEAGEMGAATRDELITAIHRIAAVDEIAPYYMKGSRHDFTLHLAGTLIGWRATEDEVTQFVSALCAATNDEEEDRLVSVATTFARAMEGEPISGWNDLSKLLGSDAMRKFEKLWHGDRAPSLTPVNRATSADLDLPDFSDDHRNDSGVGKEFAKSVKGKMAWVDDMGSFWVYKKGIWEEDGNGIAASHRMARIVHKWIEQFRSSSIPTKEMLEIVKFLQRYKNASQIASALKQSRVFLNGSVSQFDRYDDLVGLRNGVLCLRTGELFDPAPEYYLTRRINLDYDPEASCPNFMAFLQRIFAGDQELIEFVQVTLGYCLTGRTDRQEFYIWYGAGANGKSTLTGILERILGPYCGTMMADTLFEGKQQGAGDLGTLIGKRLAIASESESDARLYSARIKQVTGDRTVKVKKLYKDAFEMAVKFKIIMTCNKTPSFDGTDKALMRRIRVVPFDVQIPTAEMDRTLPQKLCEEREGILAWLVKGSMKYYKGFDSVPEAVEKATQECFGENDSIGPFLYAMTDQCYNGKVAVGKLYSEYSAYCEKSGLEVCGSKDFARVLKGLGFAQGRTKDERYWVGLSLKDDFDPARVTSPDVSP